MDDPIVTVKQGKLKGIVQRSVLGPTFLAFKGIPFAAPPVGELRFKEPQPPIPWSGVRDASKNGDACAQWLDYCDIGFIGSDDCLYLNVYTPSLTGPKPVMVWIHGGAFIIGSGDDTMKRPDYLMTRDVVLVSLNYRVGVFGFLNLNHKLAPGNQGLKDIIAALKWVKENIGHFGGDSNNVTIFGDSAGAVLVHYLMISPATKGKGLFHKGISMSGTALHSWARKAGPSELSFRLAAALGSRSTDPEQVLEFLQSQPCEKIVNTQKTILTLKERSRWLLPFGCVMDDVADDPVLPLPTDQMLPNDTEIPYIIGTTSLEFIMFFLSTNDQYITRQENSISDRVKNTIFTGSPEDLPRFVQTLKNHYFDGKPVDQSQITRLIKLYTDLHFTTDTIRVAEDRLKRKSAPTYVYRFSYFGNEKCTTDLLVQRAIPGKELFLRYMACGKSASHVDDSCYLFYPTLCKRDNPNPPEKGTKDRITIERLVRMWTNFAKTGNPTSELDEFVNATWQPVSEKNKGYLDIGDNLEMKPMERDLESLLN